MNILEVMDAATNNILIPNGGTYAEEMTEARAAVAELIAADRRIDFTPLDHLADDHPCVITVSAGDLRRRAAALARVGGGA